MTAPARQLDLPYNAECLACRYPLVGVAQPVCPECGRTFKPADRLSFGPSVAGTVTLWALRGPGWGTLVSAGLVVGAAALAGSVPLLSVGWLILGLMGGLAIMCVSGVRLLVALHAVARQPDFRPAFKRGLGRWGMLVVLGLLSLAMVRYKPVWWTRWLISRPALDALAADVRSKGQATGVHQRGLLRVRGAYPDGNLVRVYFDGGGFLDIPTLVHSPDAPPPVPSGGRGPFPLTGDWHLVFEDF